MVYIGAENIISPLGDSAEANFEALAQYKTGLKLVENAGNRNEALYISIMNDLEGFGIVKQTVNSIKASLQSIEFDQLKSERTILILSTTKGEIELLRNEESEAAALGKFKDQIVQHFPWISETLLISNACISGVLAIATAHDLIHSGQADHVIVAGADMLSEFTLAGFQSFFAISDEPCKPFDKNRKGINLGEGAASLILSRSKSIFKSQCFKSLGGSSANDANHISGPSRTGEGLYRTIKKTLLRANIKPEEIDFLSAHGTGTAYNDEMESIAFDRIGLVSTPLHSLKGSLGHTFGAAGVIEAAICLQSMRNNTMIASAGFEKQGTSRSINVLQKTEQKELNTILKTASGFGGCNASIIFQK